MKKKVRIYRAPDGQGAIINKTSKFLKKAQEGGMPDPNTMGYPGQQPQQAQVTEDQVAQSIVVDISNGRPKEETVMRLVNVLGQEPMMADQYYEQIYSALQQKQQESESAAEEEDEEVEETASSYQAPEMIVDDWSENNSNTQMANDIAAEDEDVDYGDDDQVASDILRQFGGVSPVIVPVRQDGGEAYPIQFPGVEAYLPPNMNEILNGQTDVLTGQAWSPVEESQAGVAPDEEPDDSYRKGGQYKKDKRSYVNSVMKLVKKQMGGEDMSKNGDTDPRGEDVRKQRLNSFLGTVKNQSNLAKTKEQAEQQFDQMMMQQQQMQQAYPMEQPMAQYGMQMRRGLFGRPKMPRGFDFIYGMPPITKMDVTKSGLFGRPRHYTLEFGDYSPMPGMPGSGAGFYGYGQTSTTKTGKTKGRIITETIAKTVNNEAIKDVATDTPNSTATNKPSLEEMRKAAAAAGYDPWNTTSVNTDPNSTASNLKENIATSKDSRRADVNTQKDDLVLNNSNTKREETKQENEIEKLIKSQIRPAAKKDKWGRPEGSKWYGFDPKKKIYTQGAKSKSLINLNPLVINPVSLSQITPFGYEEGGIINNPMPDQFGNLQQFVYGGDEPYITQADIDDVYSKDTSDPYFAMGGLTTYQNKGEVKSNEFFSKSLYDDYRKKVGDKLNMSLRDDLSAQELFEMGQKAGISFGNNEITTAPKKQTTTTVRQFNPYANVGYGPYNTIGGLFPANLVTNMGTWGKVKRGPYNKATGMMIPGAGFGPNTQIRSIDVTKSGMFGKPKKYTINYTNQEMDPRKQNLISLPGKEDANVAAEQQGSKAGKFSNTKGLKAGSRAKIAMKELFNRYNEQEEVFDGTENNVLPTQKPQGPAVDTSVQDEEAKFLQQQRKQGKMWDENTQSWVSNAIPRMDIRKPSKLDYSPNMLMQKAIMQQRAESIDNRPVGNISYQQRSRAISPSKAQLEELYNRDLMEQQYGGDLRKFVGGMEKFQPGGYKAQSPVVFTDNPAHVGMSNVDMISLNEGIPNLKPSSFWADQASFNEEVPVNAAKQPEQIKTDPTQISSDQAKKAYQATPGDFSIDVKNKTMYQVDPEAAIATVNAGVRGAAGLIDRIKNKKNEAKMYENLTADNLYASDPSRDRGDYDVNTGLYRPNEQGAVHTSRSKQYGGDTNYAEGDVVDMTEEELAQFLKSGGQVEYLNY